MSSGTEAAADRPRAAPLRCLWCGRELPSGVTVGRRRRYCAQACRQRAYESRAHLELRGLPEDAVVLTGEDRESLADRLFQVRCAAEDVATAVAEGASAREVARLVADLLTAAGQAETLRRSPVS